MHNWAGHDLAQLVGRSHRCPLTVGRTGNQRPDWLLLVSCIFLHQVRPIQPLSAASEEARASVGPTELEAKQVAENKGHLKRRGYGVT